MAEKIPERLRHALLAALLAVGLTYPLLGAMDRTLVSPAALPILLGVIVAFELVSLHRAVAWAAAGVAVIAGLLWIFGGNGARILSDAGLALGLRMNGTETAIQLVAGEITAITAAVIAVLSCFATLRQATCIPAMVLCAGAAMMVWLTDSMEMIPWLLPALSVGLTMLMTNRFDDTPAIRILPWAAALTAAAFLITGSGMTLEPLKEKADEIRQAILDRLFFTEARDVFSLYSEGYSPQGPDQLGGKPTPSERLVMQVSTPKITYLRGAIYNRYDGHGWKNTTGGRRYLWQSRRMEETRIRLFDQDLPPASVQNSMSEASSVSVRMLSESASTLFVPQRVRELEPGGETVPYFSNSSEIFITRNLQAGDTYEIQAPLYVSGDPGIGALTDICATLEDPNWESVRSTYTELPGHLEQPVMDIAMNVTSVADSPYEKALTLQNYLSRNFRYTLDVGEHPENIDFVTSFLLDTKKGYCTYFASAMTVLCRMAGLPARYVEGYLAEPDAGGHALVTGLNAHAWTEVYFKGFGWLTFDATPMQHNSRQEGGQNAPGGGTEPTPTLSPEPEEDSPTPGPEEPEETENPENETETPEPPQETETPEPPEEGETPEPPEEEPPEDNPDDSPEGENPPPEKDRKPNSFPWWILILLLLLAAGGTRILMTSPGFREKRAGTEEEKYDLWTEEISRLLKAERLTRKTGETPMAFARRTDSTGIFSESLGPAGENLSMIRYGGRTPGEADTGLMRDTATMIRGEISRGARARYWGRRIFTGGRNARRGRGKTRPGNG